MKTIIKNLLKPFLTLMAFQFLLPVGLFAGNGLVSNTSKESISMQSTERITVKFGTRSHPVENGCGGDKGICIIITASIVGGRLPELQVNEGLAEIQLLKGNKLMFNVTEDKATDADSKAPLFYVYKSYYLSPEICQALGKKKIVVLPGEYVVDYSKSAYGGVILNVSAQ